MTEMFEQVKALYGRYTEQATALEQNRNTAEQVMRRYSYSADTDHTQIRYVFFDEYGGAAAAAAVCLDKYFVR